MLVSCRASAALLNATSSLAPSVANRSVSILRGKGISSAGGSRGSKACSRKAAAVFSRFDCPLYLVCCMREAVSASPNQRKSTAGFLRLCLAVLGN